MDTSDRSLPTRVPGLVLHAALRYDLLVWIAMFGRERAFREKILQLARLGPGEAVLDVGCGTGTLAIAAKRRVGAGMVCGIDASPEMIVRAAKKARKAGVEVSFQRGAAQALPFPDGQFDAALSTVMLHHLPRKSREECAREMMRVVKPGGRVLAVDFAASAPRPGGVLGRLHRRHGHLGLGDIVALLRGAGLEVVASGAVGFRDTQFAVGTRPRGA